MLRPLAIMLGIQNMAFAAVFSVFVLYAVDPGPMGLSEAGFGVLLATLGVGSLLGTWLAVPAERRLGRVRTLVLSVVLGGRQPGRARRHRQPGPGRGLDWP